MKISYFVRIGLILISTFFFGTLIMAQANPKPVKVLYLRTGWSTADARLLIPKFIEALQVQNLKITLNDKGINDFDGSQVAQGDFDVVYYADDGMGFWIDIKESAQLAIRDFVNKGGTFIHEAGLTQLIAKNPEQYKTMRDLILFESPSVACQCYFSFAPAQSSQAGLTLLQGVSPVPLEDFKCHIEYYDGDVHPFSEGPSELAVVNTQFGEAQKMVAVRNVGAGRVIGVNFRFYFDTEDCNPKSQPLVQFYSNLFHFAR